MIKAVILDLDGTIVHLKLRIKEAKKKFLRKLRECGVDIGSLTIDVPTEIIMKSIKDKPRSWLMKLVDDSFLPYELEAAEEAELRDDAREVLEKLREEGFKLGLASNNGRVGVYKALKRLGIADLFDVVVTRNDVNSMKPDGKLVSKAVEMLRVARSEAVYVGDTIYDVEAARNAGVRCIVVLGGGHPLKKLREAEPDAIIKDLRELREALRSLN